MGNEADERASLGAHYIERKEYSVQHRRERRDAINQVKNVPCADCGVRYPPYVMDLDHIRGMKMGDISDMVSASVSMDLIMEEVEKCEVVCANCHRERTHLRHGG